MTDVPSDDRRTDKAGRRDTDRVLDKIYFILKIMVALVIIQFIIQIGSQFQLSARNQTLDDIQRSQITLNKAADATRESAIATQKALDAAISQSQNPENLKPFLENNERIKRIEIRLCGGPCP